MNENFPLNKKDYTCAALSIQFKDQIWASTGKNNYAPLGISIMVSQQSARIRKNLPKNDNEQTVVEVEEGHQLECALDHLFLWTEGRIDKFYLDYDECEETEEKSQEMLKYIMDAFANRTVSTTFLIQEAGATLGSPSQAFLREHLEYSMYAGTHSRSGDYPPIEITEKLLKCEFLCFNCRLSNPEVLTNFKGWGLAVFYVEYNKFNFDFFFQVVQDFISGKDIQWRYLAFAMVPPEGKWNALVSKGKLVTFKFGGEKYKEIKFKRADKEKARIGRIEEEGETYIYFYRGKLTEKLKAVNVQFRRKMH